MPAPPGQSVIVTAPSLTRDAVALIERAGGILHYTAPYPTEATMIAAARSFDPVAILSRQGAVSAAVMDAAPRLRIIARHGVGVDDVDLDAARARRILVTRAPGSNTGAVAEHTMAVLLAMVKRLPAQAATIAAGGWRGLVMGGDVAGLRLGLVGAGSIARAVAGLAGAFGLTVTAYSRHGGAPGLVAASSFRALLAGSDIVSLHVPRTPETVDLIDAAALAAMPRGAWLINTARGGLVNEAALLGALDRGHIAGAALDVFTQEPPGVNDRLRTHPLVIATAHSAGVTPGSLITMGVMAGECIAAVLNGRSPAPERLV